MKEKILKAVYLHRQAKELLKESVALLEECGIHFCSFEYGWGWRDHEANFHVWGDDAIKKIADALELPVSVDDNRGDHDYITVTIDDTYFFMLGEPKDVRK